ncbi:MAG: helix-turn-helix transcriptional regulator [Candidatus Thiodiazotropha sp.]
MDIGEVVRILRKQAKLSQDELAGPIRGYDGGNLSRFENSEQSIHLDKLKAIATLLNTNLAEMFAIAETKPYRNGIKEPSGKYLSKKSTNRLTNEIDELISHYIHADQRGRNSIMGIARIQTEKHAIKGLQNAHDGEAVSPTSTNKKKAEKS